MGCGDSLKYFHPSVPTTLTYSSDFVMAGYIQNTIKILPRAERSCKLRFMSTSQKIPWRAFLQCFAAFLLKSLAPFAPIIVVSFFCWILNGFPHGFPHLKPHLKPHSEICCSIFFGESPWLITLKGWFFASCDSLKHRTDGKKSSLVLLYSYLAHPEFQFQVLFSSIYFLP